MSEDEAVAVEAPLQPMLEALQARQATLEQEADALTATLGEMWQQRQHGTLPKGLYAEYFYFEDQLRVTLQALEQLGPQLRFAEAEAAITHAKAHHDRLCPLVNEQGLRVCEAWKTFLEECAALVQVVDDQIDPLLTLTRPDGQPMFEPDSGRTTLYNMLNAFPNNAGFLAQSVLPFLSDLITTGQAGVILSHVKGKEPFADTNVARYLAQYRVPEDKPETPVEE